MSQTGEDSEKSHEPSQKKLQDARKKGDIVRSNDITAAAAYAGFWIGFTVVGTGIISGLYSEIFPFLASSDTLAAAVLAGPASISIGNILIGIVAPLGGLFGIPILTVLAALLAQRAIVFAPSKIQPKISRISPISNAKNKFGRSGLFEFLKSLAKLLIYSVCLFIFLRQNLDQVLTSMLIPTRISISVLAELTLNLLLIIAIIATCLAAIDYMFQRAEFLRKNRMSHKELTDEAKEAEGDPAMKARRRGKAQEIALNGMLTEVPKADVVVVNPTHYAVALSWDKGSKSAPVCVAKGVDEIALKIRELAIEAGVPIHSDPPTARAIHATTELGEEVGTDFYEPVAAAIRFAELMRAKAKGYKQK